MAFNDFTLETAERDLGIVTRVGDLFGALNPVAAPPWLRDILVRSSRIAMVSEKSRSEFIVAPILLAMRELSGDRISILSGQRLDVDPVRRLTGECDFLLSNSEPVPRLRAPLMAVVEAKRGEIEAGLGQCVAQLFAAQLYNETNNQSTGLVSGCVTNSEVWQFLNLRNGIATLHPRRFYLDELDMILAALLASVPA